MSLGPYSRIAWDSRDVWCNGSALEVPVVARECAQLICWHSLQPGL